MVALDELGRPVPRSASSPPSTHEPAPAARAHSNRATRSPRPVWLSQRRLPASSFFLFITPRRDRTRPLRALLMPLTVPDPTILASIRIQPQKKSHTTNCKTKACVFSSVRYRVIEREPGRCVDGARVAVDRQDRPTKAARQSLTKGRSGDRGQHQTARAIASTVSCLVIRIVHKPTLPGVGCIRAG